MWRIVAVAVTANVAELCSQPMFDLSSDGRSLGDAGGLRHRGDSGLSDLLASRPKTSLRGRSVSKTVPFFIALCGCSSDTGTVAVTGTGTAAHTDTNTDTSLETDTDSPADTDTSADADTDSESATSDGAAVDCETVVREFDTPLWSWVGEFGTSRGAELVVLPGAELATLRDNVVQHWERGGQPGWSTTMPDGVNYSSLARLSNDALLLAGSVPFTVDPEHPTRLASLSTGGVLVRERDAADDTPGGRESPTAVVSLANGHFAVMVSASQSDQTTLRVDVYDAEFDRFSSFKPRPTPGPPTLFSDGDSRLFVVTTVLEGIEDAYPSLVYTWDVQLDAYSEAGVVEWIWSRTVEHTNALGPRLTTSDPLVLQLVPTQLQAFADDGTPKWNLDLADTRFSEVTAIAGNPCGGVFVAGPTLGTGFTLAALGHIDPHGEVTSLTYLDEPIGVEDGLTSAEFARVEALRVSATGDVIATGRIASSASLGAETAPWIRAY